MSSHLPNHGSREPEYKLGIKVLLWLLAWVSELSLADRKIWECRPM